MNKNCENIMSGRRNGRKRNDVCERNKSYKRNKKNKKSNYLYQDMVVEAVMSFWFFGDVLDVVDDCVF